MTVTPTTLKRSLVLAISLLAGAGCESLGGPPAATIPSVDGLSRVDAALPGILELRPDHGIGGYDEIVVPKATLNYERLSRRLTPEARKVSLRILRDSLVVATEAASIPFVTEPRLCAMQIDLEASGMNLDIGSDATQLAEITFVMEFRDSLSGQPLLRYSTKRTIDSPEVDQTHGNKLRRGLNVVVKNLNLASSLRGAGLASNEIREGCNGTFAARGRAAQGSR